MGIFDNSPLSPNETEAGIQIWVLRGIKLTRLENKKNAQNVE